MMPAPCNANARSSERQVPLTSHPLSNNVDASPNEVYPRPKQNNLRTEFEVGSTPGGASIEARHKKALETRHDDEHDPPTRDARVSVCPTRHVRRPGSCQGGARGAARAGTRTAVIPRTHTARAGRREH